MSKTKPYKFYAMDHSYYSGKVRPYLRYKGIPFKEIVSTLWVYKRFIIPRTGVRFIPVLQSPDDIVVQDTTEIIDFLEQRFPDRPIYPSTPKQKLTTLLFELFADEWFLFPAMHYRWSYLNEHKKWLMGEFGRVLSNHAPAPVRRLVGQQLAKQFHGFLGPLGINQDTGPAIERVYLRVLDLLNTHFQSHDYLLGTRPSMGDFALAGPLYAHLWLDPYPKQIMEREAPAVVQWIERINASEQPAGEFLENDEVPETLNPLLEIIFAEHFPILSDTVQRVAQWLEEKPNRAHISRAIGEHSFRIGGVSSTRLVFPYSQWMLQRPLDCYQALEGSERSDVDAWLSHLGGLQAMQLEIPRRVERRNNRLVAAA
ncbi:MAG: glutathione S-transferase family protein [Nevskiales bacterium]